MDKKVLEVLKKTKKPISIERICEKLEITADKDIAEVRKILDDYVKGYSVIKTPNNNYISIGKTSFRKGRYYANRNGSGKVVVITDYVDSGGKHVVKNDEYVIDRDNTLGAIDGDEVLVDIASKKDRKGVKTAQITDIIGRDLQYIAGEVYRLGSSFFVKPIDKKKQGVTIALKDEAIEGQRVAVVLDESSSNNFYTGTIIRTFGHKDDPAQDKDDDILWEAFKCGISDKFSDESLEQVKKTPTKVLDSDRIGRHDLTDWEIFTIDGEDTKDIDDALSCKVLENGNYLIGVHIADVSHYVPAGSPLDKDAFIKGTSAYLGGKVIPMLPHELSNGICSLNPHVERLALSCIMEVTPDGKVVKHNIWPTIIKSNIKMSYTKVNQILKEGVVPEEYESHAGTIRNLNKLALILRKNRIKEGAVEFDRPELKVVLDDDGMLQGISVRHQDLGENLIEEFMLLANETVDRRLEENGYPAVHRVHDVPNQERMQSFLNLLNAVGYGYVKYDAAECCSNPHALQDLTEHIKKTGRLANMLSTNLIRCMSRAKYSHVNIGHNGLAKENYCHFTSPIRRYPDLTIHRIVKDCVLTSDRSGRNKRRWETKVPDIAYQSSKMERNADAAETEVLNMKCAEYMSQFVGNDFEATVVGISDSGLQIQLDNMIEGRVRPKDLPGCYEYNAETYSLLSLDGKEDYFIGDRLSVRLKSSDKESKHIDFSVNCKIEENSLVGVASKNKEAKVIAKTKRANQKR